MADFAPVASRLLVVSRRGWLPSVVSHNSETMVIGEHRSTRSVLTLYLLMRRRNAKFNGICLDLGGASRAMVITHSKKLLAEVLLSVPPFLRSPRQLCLTQALCARASNDPGQGPVVPESPSRTWARSRTVLPKNPGPPGVPAVLKRVHAQDSQLRKTPTTLGRSAYGCGERAARHWTVIPVCPLPQD
jgi:hypothetical protein